MLKILVTAGAGGIGRAIARAFAADGARVHIADINEAAVRAMVEAHPGVTGSVADISQPDQVARVFSEMAALFDGLDVLVNNAGISGPTSPVENYDLAAWQAVLNVNLTGTFLVTQHAIPLLKQSAQGSVIVMSSLAGRFGYANRVAYATSKWGLVGFTKTLALELGAFGITCNAIQPGAVAGPRLDNIHASRAALSGRTVADEVQRSLANQSVKRFVEAEEIAELVKFLCGPNARAISGQAFPMDGDSKASQ